jgi:NTP pyrophosphatase (non-canonical NTP hydrolase)|tara:strand:- start:1903 stop:2226 length:324 start_codon:yes stop_codon:yes gene_type:complete
MGKSLTLTELKRLVMAQAIEKGFGVRPEDINVAEKLALIHSEVSEALEAYRHKRFEGKHCFGEELADVIQRTLHLAGVMNVDIEKEFLKKFEINKSRSWDGMNETLV